jgi:PAS domain S-box-containing protein
MPKLRPLSRWLTLQFALVASMPLVVVAALVWFVLLPQMRTDMAVRHQALAQAIAGRVAAHLLGADHALRALADYVDTQGHQPPPFWISLLDAGAGSGDVFEAIYIADENKAVSAVGLPQMRRSKRDDLIGLDLSRRDFVGEAQMDKKEVWSETFLSTVSSRLAVALALPLRNRVMIGEITIERLSQFISQLPVEAGLFTTIIDRQGRIIADSRPGFGGRQVDSGIHAILSDELNPGTTTFEMDGKALIGTIVAVEQVGWKVLVAQPYPDAFRLITTTMRMLAVSLAISLMLAAAAGWLQARGFSRHFRRYTEQARSIADGDYDQPWPVSSISELADLAGNLQRMSHAIRQREMEITASEAKYRTLFETMAQGVIYVDVDGRIMSANPAAEGILGLSLEQMRGCTLLDPRWQAIGEDGTVLDGENMPVMVALRTGLEVRNVVVGFANPNAERVTWVNLDAMPQFQSGEERPFQVYATLRDVTERKRGEEALRLSERNLSITLDSIGDAVIATDTDGVVTRLNPIAEQLTGWTAAEAVGRPLPEVFHIVNAYTRQEVESPVEKVITEGQIVGLANHTVLIAKDGTEYQIADSGAPIRRADGQTTGVVLVFRDVTEAYLQAQIIRESEQLLRSITTNLPGVVFQFCATADHQYGLKYVSENTAEVFGLDVPLEGFFPAILANIPDGEKEKFLASIHEAVERERPWQYEGRYLKPSGATIWFHGSSIPHRKGSEILFDGLLLDITELKRTQEALYDSRQMLQLVLDTIPQRVFWKDRNFSYLGCNKPFAGDAGLDDPEVIIGKDDFELVWKDVAQLYQNDDQGVMETNLAKLSYEELQTQADGRVMWLNTSKVPLHDRSGNVIGVLGTYEDITERKQAENELRKLRNYLVNIIDSMPSVLVGVDSNGRVTQWNRHAQITTGMDAGAVLGKPLEAAYPLLSNKMARIKETIRTGKVHKEQKVPRQDQREMRYEDFIIYPLITNGVEGAVIRVDDVTERVRLEEMMVQSEKMLSVGGLAAGMAHEINNPLAGLLQSAMVLENRLQGDLEANHIAAAAVGTSMEMIKAYMEARGLGELLSGIRESGNRAARIVRNMLEFARKSDRAFSSHLLSQVMDQTVELAASDYDLRKNYDFKRMQIVREYAEDLPEVPCDKSKIQQVLLNILKNGAQAMAGQGTCDDQPPRFILRTRRDGDMARIEIEDNGPGMDEATRKRVFEPFFTTKPVDRGTGLGLSVSYFIIAEDHGGTLSVSSAEGKGTIFSIRLPLEGRDQP